jgi:hypothetical protein
MEYEFVKEVGVDVIESGGIEVEEEDGVLSGDRDEKFRELGASYDSKLLLYVTHNS